MSVLHEAGPHAQPAQLSSVNVLSVPDTSLYSLKHHIHWLAQHTHVHSLSVCGGSGIVKNVKFVGYFVTLVFAFFIL